MTKLLTVSNVADQLGVTTATVYRWVKMGAVPHMRVGRTIRFREEDLGEALTKARDASVQVPARTERPTEEVAMNDSLQRVVDAIADGVIVRLREALATPTEKMEDDASELVHHVFGR